jgi:hypothetical protein
MRILVNFFLVLFTFSIFMFSDAFALSIFRDNSKIIYCQDGECSLDEWIDVVKRDLNDLETNRTASQYVQDIVRYLLTFITIIAVFYIIYAWFKILTSAWSDDEITKSKTTIVSVLVWIVIIWLSYAIVTWIIWVVTS